MPVTSPNSVPLGTAVNVVQKQDQPTGRLTPGVVAQLLTKGPHPRGVKVRLQDGRVGRVHALGSGGATGSHAPNGASVSEVAGQGSGVDGQAVGQGGLEVRSHGGGGGGRRFQRDVRLEDQPLDAPEERSLEDYVTIKVAKPRGKRKAKGSAGAVNEQQATPAVMEDEGSRGAGHRQDAGREGEVEDGQETLQNEFPHLDSALIAAILGDVGDVDAAREVLGKVS